MQKNVYSDVRKGKFKINRKKVIISAVIAVLLLCALTVGMLVAKYLNEKNSVGTVMAKNFYFTSDFLDGKTHTLAPDSTSITFTLGNHEDDLRYSEVDIEYTVTVTGDASVLANGTGKLANGSVNDAKVTVSNLQPGTYTVTAVGKGGYTKTLTATIVIPEKTAKLYYHIDNSAGEYTLLTVWNEGDKAGSVTVKYTGIPDNTNPNMTDWRTNGRQYVSIGPHESKVFRFFGGTVTVTGAQSKELY